MAGGAGGQEVGRISIRVVPNTDRFRADLQRQLTAIENEVRATVDVGVDLDSAGAKTKLKALMEEMRAAAARDIKVKTSLDSNALQNQMKADLAKAVSAVNGEGNRPKIKFDLAIDDRFDYALRQRIAKIKPKIKVDVEVDQHPLDKLFNSISNELATGGAGGGLGGLGGLSHGLLIVAAVAALAAPALALISGVLVSLPALFAAVAIPIGAMVLGMDGIKKAAEVLKAPFDALKTTMSAATQIQFTPVFQRLADLLPHLGQVLPAVTQGVADLAGGLVDAVTSAPGMAALDTTISNVAKALSAGAPGLQTFTTGLLNLASSVSSHLPGLSTFLEGFADRFTAWVDKITKKSTGNGPHGGVSPLDTAMGNLRITLQGVLDLVAKLGEKGFDFLSDPNFGQKMGDFLDKVKDFVENTLPDLKTFFEDLVTGIDKASAAISKLPKVPDSTQGRFYTGKVENNPDPNGPGSANFNLDKFREAITGMQNLATSAAEQIKLTFGLAWSSVSAGASAAFNQIPGIVASIVGTIGSTLSTVGSVLSSAWSGLGSIASAAWQSVVQSVSSAMANALNAVVTGAGQIVSEIAALGGKVAGAVANFGSALVAAGKALMDGLLSGIKSGLQGVLDFASSIAAKIAAVKGPLPYDKTVLTPNGQALMEGLQDGIEGGFEGVLSRARQLAGEIAAAINSGDPISLDLVDQLKKQMAEITLENDALSNAKNATTDKDQKKAITGQKQQLQTVRDQLKEQSDQIKYSDEYGDSLKKNDDVMGDTLNKMITAGTGFATANMKQLQGDLGIGGGAITGGLDAGIGYATQMLGKLVSGAFGGKTEIHVNSVDEAMAAKQTEQNKKALAYTRR